MNTPTVTPTETVHYPASFQYGGLEWHKIDRDDKGVEYKTAMQGRGEFRIYQYPEGSYCAGEWLWCANLSCLLPKEIKLNCISLDSLRAVVDTQVQALSACLNARDLMEEDIKNISLYREIGNYATGFLDGQAALTDKIKAVLS